MKNTLIILILFLFLSCEKEKIQPVTITITIPVEVCHIKFINFFEIGLSKDTVEIKYNHTITGDVIMINRQVNNYIEIYTINFINDSIRKIEMFSTESIFSRDSGSTSLFTEKVESIRNDLENCNLCFMLKDNLDYLECDTASVNESHEMYDVYSEINFYGNIKAEYRGEVIAGSPKFRRLKVTVWDEKYY